MKTHKTTKPTIALLGILALGAFISLSTPARAFIEPFVRGGVDFSKFNAIKNISDGSVPWKDKLNGWKAGYFGEVGVKLLGSHSISAEVGILSAKSDSTEKSQVPVLLNYRKYFNFGSAMSLYLGGSVGAMSDKTKWREEVGAAWGDWKDFKSTWVPLYGATAGLSFKVAKNCDFDFGVRVLGINSKSYTGELGGHATTTEIGKANFHIRPNARFALSLHW